jgi:cleavage and polyadenylation specificity factor subunit 3
MPIFALGRAQELMLMIEDIWRANPKFNKVKVYYFSNMGKKAMKTYQTFSYSMNDNIQKIKDFKNPFEFDFVTDVTEIQDIQTPCVVLANPG